MKILVTSIAAIIILFISMLTVKYWGQGQVYSDYKHIMYQQAELPIEFIKPNYNNLDQLIKSDMNLYLDLSITFDQKFVLMKRKWTQEEKPVRLQTFDEIKNEALLLTDFKDYLSKKKIIFNLTENASAVHESFMVEMKKMGFEKGENFIVTSPYEAPMKALKEIAPALLFGSTQPEILKIVAMQSMYLLEAVNIRADVIIYPLKIHNQNFFNKEILTEMEKRHKRIIVGPITHEELNLAKELKPFGVVVSQ